MESHPDLVEALQRRMKALHAHPQRNELDMLRDLTLLPSKVPHRSLRLRKTILDLEESCLVDRHALITVLWEGVQLGVEAGLENARMAQRRLSIGQRKLLMKNARQVIDQVCEAAPGTNLAAAAVLFSGLLDDPHQWPTDSHDPRDSGVGDVKHSEGRGLSRLR